jgi:D-aminoacyl-tRNA deacylase
MRAVLQRVLSANVQVDQVIVGQIEQGWLVLLGVEQGDTVESVRWLAEKTVNLRAFADDQGKMNRSVLDLAGQVLIVSQFTLAGDCRKGRRPSFDRAAVPEEARKLYELFLRSGRFDGSVRRTRDFSSRHASHLGQRWACDLRDRSPLKTE